MGIKIMNWEGYVKKGASVTLRYCAYLGEVGTPSNIKAGYLKYRYFNLHSVYFH